MDPLKKISKGSKIIFLGMALTVIINYVFRIVISKLGKAEYGLYSLGFATIEVAAIISLIGLHIGGVRYISLFKAKGEKLKAERVIRSEIKIVAIVSVVVAFLLYIFAEKISTIFFHEPGLTPILKLFIFALPFYSLSQICISIMLAYQHIKKMVIIGDLLQGLAKIILTVILILLGYKIAGVILAVILSFILIFIYSYSYIRKMVNFKWIKEKIDWEVVYFSIPLMISSIALVIMKWADSFMIGYFLNIEQVGIYNVAVPTALLLTVFIRPLHLIFYPVITEIVALKKSIKHIHKTVVRWVLAINIPLALILIIFSKKIIIFLFGQEYATAALTLSILAFFYFLDSIMILNKALLSIFKKTKEMAVIVVFALIINIILNWFLIPLWGIIGAAIATGSSILIIQILYLIFFYKLKKEGLYF
jgi:O-antigen/teichoic acid export membrane protein